MLVRGQGCRVAIGDGGPRVTDPARLAAHIAERGIGTVDLKICDLEGRWRHLAMPARVFLDARKIGIGVDASNYGLAEVDRSDASLRFDAGHVFLDPFAGSLGPQAEGLTDGAVGAMAEAAVSGPGAPSARTTAAASAGGVEFTPALSVIAQLARADGEALPDDPRGVAQRAEVFLRSSGVADESLWLPELEFYVFKSVRLALNPFEVGHHVATVEGMGDVDGGALGTAYQMTPPVDRLQGVRARTAELLQDAGFPVKYHHHEVGAPGQVEIELGFMPLVEAADAILTAKYFARNVAAEAGLVANFMPKPLRGYPGNGMHVHVMLERAGKGNVFAADLVGAGRSLNDLAYSFIAGILRHADALSAFANPTTNSYRRLSSGHEAPSAKTFGAENRNAAIRIPAYAPDRFEYRPLDATANPYLALAALVMAGLDGVAKGATLEGAEVGPRSGAGTGAGTGAGAGTLTGAPTGAGLRLPETLDAALAALEQDNEFLTVGGVFTRSLLETWIASRRRECEKLAEWPHPWEFASLSSL